MPLLLDDERKGGESSDTVLPTNNDAIKLLETCLWLYQHEAIQHGNMSDWLCHLVSILAHTASYHGYFHGVDDIEAHIQQIIRKFNSTLTTSKAFANNEPNQEQFKVAYYLFFKIFNGIMRQNFNNSIPVLDYSSPMNRATMSSDIDALLNETKKSFEPYEDFVAEQMDHVKMQWTELLENLRDPHIEGQFRGVTVRVTGSHVNLENVINDFFENVFDEINIATSMDALQGILNNARSRLDVNDPGYPFNLSLGSSACMLQPFALLFTGLGFLFVPGESDDDGDDDGDDYDYSSAYDIGKPSDLAIGFWCVAAISWALSFKLIADYILSRSANTWLENFLNAIDPMRPILTDARSAIRDKQTELFGRGGATAVEAHRASIRRIERGEQQFEKCMEFITSFYVLQASHPDGLEKLQKPQKQQALIRYRNEPDAQQTHKEYIETSRDLMGDNDWFNDQGVDFAIDKPQVYDAQEDDINSASSTNIPSSLFMSSRMELESSSMGELKEEEEDEEDDIENQRSPNVIVPQDEGTSDDRYSFN